MSTNTLDKLWSQLPAGSLLLPPKELAFKFARMALLSVQRATGRVLLESDAFCPSCGHNRNTSSVSSVDLGVGVKQCQMCSALWTERDEPAAAPRRFLGTWHGVDINENTPVDTLLDIIVELGKKAPPKFRHFQVANGVWRYEFNEWRHYDEQGKEVAAQQRYNAQNTDRLRLMSLLRTGKSLVFVQWREHLILLRSLCRTHEVPFREFEAHDLNCLFKFEAAEAPCCLANVAPTLSTGLRIKADRIVWIGSVNPGNLGTVLQSFGRGGFDHPCDTIIAPESDLTP